MIASTSDSFDDLKAVVLSALARPAELLATEKQFNELALRIYRFQRASNPFYSRYCDAVGAPPEPSRWQDIPAVPTSAFKRAEIRSFPPEHTVAFFQTSGTTESDSGRHFFPTLELYEAAIRPNFRAHLLPDLPAGDRMPMHILTPPPDQAPHSSLVHMKKIAVEFFGAPDSAYYLRDARLQSDELLRNLDRAASAGRPVVLLGTAFAFVYFLEALAVAGRADLPLPPGSRLMETGGFKGRTRDVPRA